MPKEIFIVRSRITLQAAIFDCSEVAVHCHSLSKIYPENTGGRVKLQTDFWLNYRLTVQRNDNILK